MGQIHRIRDSRKARMTFYALTEAGIRTGQLGLRIEFQKAVRSRLASMIGPLPTERLHTH